MTWPSFLAASISAGVTASAAGASARTRVENAAPASKPPVTLSASRREILVFFIASLIHFIGRAEPAWPCLLYSAHGDQVHDPQLPDTTGHCWTRPAIRAKRQGRKGLMRAVGVCV